MIRKIILFLLFLMVFIIFSTCQEDSILTNQNISKLSYFNREREKYGEITEIA